jgi:hypothetical protein
MPIIKESELRETIDHRLQKLTSDALQIYMSNKSVIDSYINEKISKFSEFSMDRTYFINLDGIQQILNVSTGRQFQLIMDLILEDLVLAGYENVGRYGHYCATDIRFSIKNSNFQEVS